MTSTHCPPIDRRTLLRAVAAGSTGLLIAAARVLGLSGEPLFTLGVASGDPAPGGMCRGPGWRPARWTPTAA